MKRILVSFVACALAGCAVSGGITPVAESRSGFDGAVYAGLTTRINAPSGAEQFRIFNQGSTGFVSAQANLEDAEARGKRFCEQKGYSYRVISETVSQPPHILGNFPRAEIVFECVGQLK